MSFSFDVKKELIQSENTPQTAAAQSYGFLLYGRSFSRSSVSLMTDREALADAYIRAIRVAVPDAAPEKTCSQAGRFTVTLPRAEDRLRLLQFFGYNGKEIGLRLNFALVEDPESRGAFLRGVFLACGSVTDPQKEYHLELCIGSHNLTRDFLKLFDEYDGRDPELAFTLKPGQSARGGVQVVYFNDSESVEDFLSLIGAQTGAMAVMNAKVIKDVRNNVNRRVNFETANLSRSCDAGATQVLAIKRLQKKGKLRTLPEDLRKVALLRLEEPDISLRELGSRMDPPMSRAAVNYRLRRLMMLAEDL